MTGCRNPGGRRPGSATFTAGPGRAIPEERNRPCQTAGMQRGVGWLIALMCFGLALVVLAILLYANHPEWF
jgi:hypothetical protein